jgi:hypothetical protein
MPITIRFGAGEPTASAELLIKNQLPQHHLEKTEAVTARELDSTLASRPFKLLLDELRAILEHEIEDSGLEIIQLAGAAGLDAKVYRPAICFVLREREGGARMSELARERVTEIAETLREELNLS